MNDSTETDAQGGGSRSAWLLLIHQLPPKPDYLRVKIRRRLRGLGAVAVKQTVYALPNTDESLEDFHWLRAEIEAGGGSAVIVQASLVAGLSDEELNAMIDNERRNDSGSASTGVAPAEGIEPGRQWVTRQGVGIDRIASAWLITRFIDPAARFAFVPARGYRPAPGELRFDMFEAEFTHAGESCTFEVLAKHFRVEDRAVRVIGEIVHDIDCKDERFGRPETPGVARIIKGIVDTTPDDATRLARGAVMLNDLYASLGTRRE